MEIPSTTRYDFSYKDALRFLWHNPNAKVLVAEGICPYIELPGQTETIRNTIWPVSFGRLLSLDLLQEHWETDPTGNGRKQRKVWLLNRQRAKPIVFKKRGRPETIIKIGELLIRCQVILEKLIPLIVIDAAEECNEAREVRDLIDQWIAQPSIEKQIAP
jgi:hypothetical protein